jgi:cob(I)alamin adenosyltransferase
MPNMRIYTKFGDTGNTSLIGGTTVPKNDPRMEAYGCVDELNAVLGVVIAFTDLHPLSDSISSIQNDLFIIGAELASKGTRSKPISPARVGELEKEIDMMWEQMPPLKNFIIPGGSKTAALLHLARTVCRRAERAIVTLSQKERVNPETLRYINRVGDLLFVHARYVNHQKKKTDIIWKGRR